MSKRYEQGLTVRDRLLQTRHGNYLREGAEYVAGERRALPDVDLVVGLYREIQALQQAAKIRGELLYQATHGVIGQESQ